MQGIQDTPSQLLLLNIPQVMQMLGLSRSKVHKLIKREELPVMRFGRAVRISPSDLEQWLQERK